MDETSINIWAAIKKRTWTDGSITLPYQSSGGFKNTTVIGAIGGDETNFKFLYQTKRCTNTDNVLEFL